MMPEEQIRLNKSRRFVNFLTETKMKEYSSFDRYQPFLEKGELAMMRPDGQWLFSAEDLPNLPIPKIVIVTNDGIEIDGWIFYIYYINRDALTWFIRSINRWKSEADSDRTREWIEGIKETFELAAARKL
jgi:hypothetical protein